MQLAQLVACFACHGSASVSFIFGTFAASQFEIDGLLLSDGVTLWMMHNGQNTAVQHVISNRQQRHLEAVSIVHTLFKKV